MYCGNKSFELLEKIKSLLVAKTSPVEQCYSRKTDMVKKARLIELLGELKASALDRNTLQGVPLFERTLSQLNDATENDDLLTVFASVSAALSGINAHGYFTNKEYQCVCEIWEMKD